MERSRRRGKKKGAGHSAPVKKENKNVFVPPKSKWQAGRNAGGRKDWAGKVGKPVRKERQGKGKSRGLWVGEEVPLRLTEQRARLTNHVPGRRKMKKSCPNITAGRISHQTSAKGKKDNAKKQFQTKKVPTGLKREQLTKI